VKLVDSAEEAAILAQIHWDLGFSVRSDNRTPPEDVALRPESLISHPDRIKRSAGTKYHGQSVTHSYYAESAS
jgi:hypothetical protein